MHTACSLSLSIQNGDTPLMAARQSGDVEMVRVLTEAHVEQVI